MKLDDVVLYFLCVCLWSSSVSFFLPVPIWLFCCLLLLLFLCVCNLTNLLTNDHVTNSEIFDVTISQFFCSIIILVSSKCHSSCLSLFDHVFDIFVSHPEFVLHEVAALVVVLWACLTHCP